MLIRCWGARGSLPVSGQRYVKYGGNTTCIEIRTEDDRIIVIDAGTGIRELGNLLVAEGRNEFSMLFTHSHWDHILGFPFFKPIYRRDTIIHVCGCAWTQESLRGILAQTMLNPYFPVDFDFVSDRLRFAGECRLHFNIGSVEVAPIRLNHPNQGYGYRFTEAGRSFVFLTDNELDYIHPGGLPYKDYVEFSREADYLIHDAEYLPQEYRQFSRTWGHSMYLDALRLAMEAEVKRFGLFHHNVERSDDQMDAIVDDCRERIVRAGVKMECFALQEGHEVRLD